MLGDIVELSVVVRDLDAAVERYTRLFGLTVHHRGESQEFGFKNAILPTGIGHIELLQPTDPNKATGRFLARTARACTSWASSARTSRAPPPTSRRKARASMIGAATSRGCIRRTPTALFVELRHRETYDYARWPARFISSCWICRRRRRRCGRRSASSCARRWARTPLS